MGADLYIKTISDEIDNKAGPRPNEELEFSKWMQVKDAMMDESGGYFRDSYNSSNLLNLIDFSYWSTPEELKWTISRNCLTVASVRKLLNYWNANKVKLELVIKCKQRADDRTYFINKAKEFDTFINKAVELKSSIKWSV
jgi:hypothetical protein